jgi:hypothetical protein
VLIDEVETLNSLTELMVSAGPAELDDVEATADERIDEGDALGDASIEDKRVELGRGWVVVVVVLELCAVVVDDAGGGAAAVG